MNECYFNVSYYNVEENYMDAIFTSSYRVVDGDIRYQKINGDTGVIRMSNVQWISLITIIDGEYRSKMLIDNRDRFLAYHPELVYRG